MRRERLRCLGGVSLKEEGYDNVSGVIFTNETRCLRRGGRWYIRKVYIDDQGVIFTTVGKE